MANVTTITPFGLTAKGLELQTKLQAGEKLEITDIVIGDGYLTEGQSAAELTALIHEIPTQTTAESGSKPKADFTRLYKGTDENGDPVCMISTTIQNGDNPDTKIREFGVLANDPDEGKILYGVCNLGNSAMPFPPYDGKVHVAYDWDFSTYISNTSDVTANITFVAGVPHEEFENHVNDIDNPHNVTAGQIAETEEKQFISLEEKQKLEKIETGAQAHKPPTSAEVINAIRGQSPALGSPTAETAQSDDNSKRIATTAYVKTAFKEAMENHIIDITASVYVAMYEQEINILTDDELTNSKSAYYKISISDTSFADTIAEEGRGASISLYVNTIALETVNGYCEILGIEMPSFVERLNSGSTYLHYNEEKARYVEVYSDNVISCMTADDIEKALGYMPANSRHGHSADDISETTDRQFVTAEQVASWNGKISTQEKGKANGVAGLDGNGLVPTSQIPQYIPSDALGALLHNIFVQDNRYVPVIEYNSDADNTTSLLDDDIDLQGDINRSFIMRNQSKDEIAFLNNKNGNPDYPGYAFTDAIPPYREALCQKTEAITAPQLPDNAGKNGTVTVYILI